MKEIILKSKKYRITKLNRKTKAKGFCDLKVGDVIYFQDEIAPCGRNGDRLYASGFDCVNDKTKEIIGGFTHNESPKYLSIFELEEISGDNHE